MAQRRAPNGSKIVEADSGMALTFTEAPTVGNELGKVPPGVGSIEAIPSCCHSASISSEEVNDVTRAFSVIGVDDRIFTIPETVNVMFASLNSCPFAIVTPLVCIDDARANRNPPLLADRLLPKSASPSLSRSTDVPFCAPVAANGETSVPEMLPEIFPPKLLKIETYPS
jgi:hypothetical protein